MPPCTAGCRVLTLPPSISGAFVISETSLKTNILYSILSQVRLVLLTRLKYQLPLSSLQSLQILGVGRLHLRAPLRDPRDRFYRTQREELEKTSISNRIHFEGTIPIDCAILT